MRKSKMNGVEVEIEEAVTWQKYFKRRAIHSLVILATIAYLQVAIRIFDAVNCEDVNGQELLVAELSTVCYQGGNMAAAIVAFILMPLYLAAFPIWAFYIVKRSYTKGAYDLKRAEKYGYLYRNLKDYAFWFRSLFYLTGLTLAIQTVFASNDSLRVFLPCLFFLLNAVTVAVLRPFVTKFANWVMFCGGLICAIVGLIFMGYTYQQSRDHYDLALFVALLVVTALAAALTLVLRMESVNKSLIGWLQRVTDFGTRRSTANRGVDSTDTNEIQNEIQLTTYEPSVPNPSSANSNEA